MKFAGSLLVFAALVVTTFGAPTLPLSNLANRQQTPPQAGAPGAPGPPGPPGQLAGGSFAAGFGPGFVGPGTGFFRPGGFLFGGGFPFGPFGFPFGGPFIA